MALLCPHCGSDLVQTLLDRDQCLQCGKTTDEPVEVKAKSTKTKGDDAS